ncbi:MAG TPA: dihydrofolate reductase family protein [Actinophytocola sp.]|jgi:dihydrofolate reductase|nr:dihydrofolate reductase family protein [Actinophytocola sp.]
MQTLTVDVFVSVDGYAKGEESPGYFGYFGPGLDEWINTELARPQLAVFGRRTYEVLAGMPAQAMADSPLAGLDKVVFSRTLESTSWPKTRLCREDAVAEVARLKADGEVPLRTIGSLSLARQLCDAGLVDRLRLMTFPLFAGPTGSEPAFADLAAGDLELVDHRVLDGRVLLVEYRPTGRDIPRG